MLMVTGKIRTASAVQYLNPDNEVVSFSSINLVGVTIKVKKSKFKSPMP